MVNPPQPRNIPPNSPRSSNPPLHTPSTTASSSSQCSASNNNNNNSNSNNNNTNNHNGSGQSPRTTQAQLHHHPTISHHHSSMSHHQHPSRKPSIVELLSSPPPLPVDQDDSINHLSLSRNPSVNSRSSSLYQSPQTLNHSNSIIGLDWSEIPLSELTESNKLISIHSSLSVQEAFETLVSNNLTSVPVSISENHSDLTNCLTFDYSDLNTYLLLIMNKIDYSELNVDEIGDEKMTFQEKHDLVISNINKAKKGEEVPVEFIIKLHPKNPFIKFVDNDTLFSVMETLGNGVHRIAITDSTTNKIIGILSQRRLIKYMWENARRFPALDFYLQSTLQDLKIGSSNPITIYEDQLLIEALHKMFNERVSSLAVIDKSRTLIGNISIVDVKNVTSSKNSYLLNKSVLNFISYNLSQKGIEEGQDQFPIFHVDQQNSLGRVIAKLVATQSHRLWIVDSRKSSNSTSNPIKVGYSKPIDSNITNKAATVEDTLTETQPIVPPIDSQNIASNATKTEGGYGFGRNNIGKLIGVVTLTDILGLFANSKGRRTDPGMARSQRRRSSTSTTKSSIDSSSINTTGEPISNVNTNGSNKETITASTSQGGNGNRINATTEASSEIFKKVYTKPKENVFSK
ncbi:unnamed protein product [Candida verbasci]|uniref:CBS domain-containing protein n=1 Tax=Candida verbasci TaxID=1227364 RepID=A0A9W4XKB6_9ASCO|nr:unnamed protein product [Candida verbasci]